MSIRLMSLVWESSLPAGRKMVLLALADNANDEGECYPSVTTVARKCSMGERTVQEHIAELEKLEIVSRRFRSGRSTVYFIDSKKLTTPADFAPPQISHPTPAKSAPPPPQISHPTPADFAPITIIEPSIESPSESREGGNLNIQRTINHRRPLPNDFGVSKAIEKWAATKGYTKDLPDYLEAFICKCKANGYEKDDWDSCFKTSMLEDWGKIRERKKSPSQGKTARQLIEEADAKRASSGH